MERRLAPIFSAKHVGDPTTPDYRVFFEDADGERVSPFHDIPLVVDRERGLFRAVIEIPKGTSAKLEISRREAFNPIRQDTKSGALRFVDHEGGYMWNYGALPQTWEDPDAKHPDTGAFGDGDPLDVCEIGGATAAVGEVKTVKVLGAMALIDDGETDWKILAIDVDDPLAAQLNDVDDIERLRPGYLEATMLWLRDYKAPAVVNAFAFEGKAKPRAYALRVIEENARSWNDLIAGKRSAEGEEREVNFTRKGAA